MALRRSPAVWAIVVIAPLSMTAPSKASAQDVSTPPVADTLALKPHVNTTAGEFTPGRGFDIFKTDWASLNISFYGLFRWLDQTPADQTFRDHLGRLRIVRTRNDLNWHRSMIWLSGFFFDPKFTYNITGWSLPTSQQTLIFGNLTYYVGRALTLRVGILPNLTARSLQGTWPFWAGSDRQMVTEFLRGGFASGFAVSGEPVSRFYYTASVNTNLSQLGVTANEDDRDVAYSASVMWLPTTGEYGPRGGFGDLEYHTKVATRFGASAGHSRENRAAEIDAPPKATQIRLSDGVLAFETGALAEGATVQKLDYNEVAVDAGFKYRGFNLEGEAYWRKLSNFLSDEPVPEEPIIDKGIFGQMSYMVMPRRMGAHFFGGYVWDEFERHPWEFGGGVNIYPSGTRSWRLNAHILHVDKSPTASIFGYYAAGQTGWIFSLGIDILL
jgi:hypothetical protein